MFKRFLLSLSLVFLSPLAAMAQDGATNFVEGTHYDLIAPAVRTGNPAKIEVIEFFWYGCGHCYNFEPLISQWKKTVDDDVDFRASPAVWNKAMELHAKSYYAAEVLGVVDTMHPILFQAMNVDRKRLSSESEVEALFTANGVSAADFNKAISSFGVSSQAKQAASRAQSAKITGTPEMMVNGKYRVSTRKAGTQAKMLEVVSFLIEKERAAKG